MIVPAFIAVGDTDAEQARWREAARLQLAFYGSTPNYAFIFEQVGHEGTTEQLRAHQKSGDLGAMAAVIGDELLDEFVVTGTWDTIAAALRDRYEGTATRVVDYFGGVAWTEDPDSLQRWAAVVSELAGRAGRDLIRQGRTPEHPEDRLEVLLHGPLRDPQRPGQLGAGAARAASLQRHLGLSGRDPHIEQERRRS